MGSESLSHKFTAKDPTFKESSSSKKHEDTTSSSKNSMSHTSGTQPISLSNGSKSSSSPLIKHQRKPNSKHRSLLKFHSQQLSYISTTLDAIESLSKSNNNNNNQIVISNKERLDKLNKDIENIRNDSSKQNHIHFDQLKDDIDQLINDLKLYKMNNDKPNVTNTIDLLVGLPLDVSDNEDKTLVYF